MKCYAPVKMHHRQLTAKHFLELVTRSQQEMFSHYHGSRLSGSLGYKQISLGVTKGVIATLQCNIDMVCCQSYYMGTHVSE